MVTPRALAVALAVLVAAPRAASAHPLHSTITELVEDRAHGTVRATIRVFLDDFTAAVRKSTHDRVSPSAGAAWNAASLAYVGSAFGLTDRTGHALALRACGVKRVADLLWICVEATAPLDSLAVRDAMLCDLFDDQVNVVQATVGATRHSLLFTRGDGAKPLR